MHTMALNPELKREPKIRCAEVHRLLGALELHRSPATVRLDNGLYFFYEDGEICQMVGAPRVVRIGNHPRKQCRLRGRLNEHYGSTKNGSVFRRYLGGALMRRDDDAHACLQPAPGTGHWEKQHAKCCKECLPVEGLVSNHLRAHFSFRCVSIDDRAERNRFEQLLIATVAQCPCGGQKVSPAWLGRSCYEPNVQASGLWNGHHALSSKLLTEQDIERFSELVRASAR